MVLGGTVPPPHISGPALYWIFSTLNAVISLGLTAKNVNLWRNLCASLLYSVVGVQCRRKKLTFAISSPDELLVHFVEAASSQFAVGPIVRRALGRYFY